MRATILTTLPHPLEGGLRSRNGVAQRARTGPRRAQTLHYTQMREAHLDKVRLKRSQHTHVAYYLTHHNSSVSKPDQTYNCLDPTLGYQEVTHEWYGSICCHAQWICKSQGTARPDRWDSPVFCAH